MDISKLTHDDINNYLDKTIRKDTYLFIIRLTAGEDYETIKNDLEQHRKEYGLKDTYGLTKEETCYKYIEELEKIFKKSEDWWQEKGIYAICADDVIIYIGSTTTSFRKTYSRHLSAFNNCKKDEQYLYKVMRNKKYSGCHITMEPLICFSNLKINDSQSLRSRDINAMVLALIQIYNPIGNVMGRLAPFNL